MNTNRTSLYLPFEVEQAMKQLAGEHTRSLNGEIVQACKAWIQQERKPVMPIYEYSVAYSARSGESLAEGTTPVVAPSEDSAEQIVRTWLNTEYPAYIVNSIEATKLPDEI